MKKPLYLDYQATTPLDPRVLDAMMPYLKEDFGNASSQEHCYGWVAAAAVKLARERIAEALGADRPNEILFTSGATESDNLAILGVARAYASKGRHLITSAAEHRAVLDSCRAWEREGGEVTYLTNDRDGLVSPDSLRAAMRPDTLLVSITAANNEIGVLQPLAELSAVAHEFGALFHSDAAQAAGKIELDVAKLGIDLLSLSAHKFYGPKGVGALYVRAANPRVRLVPLQHGGGHEEGRRSGTLNVPGIVGMAEALALAIAEREHEGQRLAELRQRLLGAVLAGLEGVRLNGHAERRLPGNLNLSFADLDGSKLLLALPELALSSRSACSSAKLEPSHVLVALGLEERWTRAVLRIGLGRSTTAGEVDFAANLIVSAVNRLRERP